MIHDIIQSMVLAVQNLIKLFLKKKKLFLVLVCLVFASSFCQKANAANWHVNSESCSPAATGADWNNAKCDLNNFTSLIRGDTYFIADGDYSSYTFDDAEVGKEYIYIKKAIESDHGTDDGWNSGFGDGQAVFLNNGSSSAENIITFKTSYWDFDGTTGGGPGSWKIGYGFKITTDNPKATLMQTTHNGVGTNVSGNIKVKHTEFAHVGKDQNPSSEGTYGCVVIASRDYEDVGGEDFCTGLSGCSPGGFEYSYNYLHGSPAYIMWGMSPGSVRLEYNYFDENGHMEGGSPVQGGGILVYNAHNQTYSNNIFEDIKGNAIFTLYTWHGSYGFTVDDVKIYGNVAFNSPGYTDLNNLSKGIVSTDSGTTSVTNVKVYQNTFINLNSFYIAQSDADGGTSGCEIKNNIFYNCSGVISQYNNFQNFNLSHNWFYGNWRYNGAPISLDADWASNDSNPQIGTGDPFVDWQNGDFTLTSGTVAGNSTISSEYGTDMLGNTRGSDGVWDRGAYEYTENSGTPQAPTGLSVQ